MKITSIGGAGFETVEPMPFTVFERGLESEIPIYKAKIPPEPLPPLETIIHCAFLELDISLPSRERPATSAQSGSFKLMDSLAMRPGTSCSLGPRLPVRREKSVLLEMAEARRLKYLAPLDISVVQGAGAGQVERKPSLHRRGSILRRCSIDLRKLKPALEELEESEEEEESKPQDSESLPFPWSDQELRGIFTAFDTDHDGEVHKEELIVMLHYINAQPRPADVHRLATAMSSFATLSLEEFLTFMQQYYALLLERCSEKFQLLERPIVRQMYALLLDLGFTLSLALMQEIVDDTGKDESSPLTLKDFRLLSERVRRTEGFSSEEILDQRSIFSRTCILHDGSPLLSRSSSGTNISTKIEVVTFEDAYRIAQYNGYSVDFNLIHKCCQEVDVTVRKGITFPELLKVMRRLREQETEKILRAIRIVTETDNAKSVPLGSLVQVLQHVGYRVSEEAVPEILADMESVDENALTLAEITSFLRAYRCAEGFPLKEVQMMRQDFLNHFSNSLTRLDITSLYGTPTPSMPSTPSQSRRLRKQMTATPTIDEVELGTVLRNMGFIQLTSQRVTDLFKVFDLEQAGRISFTEFLKVLKLLTHEVALERRAVFESFDVNHDFHIAAARLPEALAKLNGVDPPAERVSEAMLQAGICMPSSMRRSPGMQTLSVTSQQFDSFCEHFRMLTIDSIRDQAGYNTAEVQELLELFQQADKDGDGLLQRKDISPIVALFFPKCMSNPKEGHEELMEMLDSLDKDDAAPIEIDFRKFLKLLRKCTDHRNLEDVSAERKVMAECGYSASEVQGFRQIFLSKANWTGELSSERLFEILSSVVDWNRDNFEHLRLLARELRRPDHIDSLRFSHFLKVMKRITEENYGGVNEAADQITKQRREGSK